MAMQTIGGSIFIRNAVKHDYCLEASIRSLFPLCSQIVALYCPSEDGTLEILERLALEHPNFQIVKGVWECAPNYSRLKILANQAISCLKTDWHFMIQADEVLHEKSIPMIKHVVEKGGDQTYLVRRPHIFGNMDHYIRHDLSVTRKPASDYVIRLGRLHHLAAGDAESLVPQNVNGNYANHMILFHY